MTSIYNLSGLSQGSNFLSSYVSASRSRTDDVSFVRPEVADMLQRYTVIRDCLGGEIQVKAQGDVYLPRPNVTDTSLANQMRYKLYLQRAVFYNVTARTQQGLLGQVFLREPSMRNDDGLDPVIKDADGLGLSIAQLAKRAVQYLIAYGRAGIFTDFPTFEDGASAEDFASGSVRPYMRVFAPWDILNWRLGRRGGRMVLTMVVLRELYESYGENFALDLRYRYYVLRLDEFGEFVVDVLDDRNERHQYQMVSSGKPRDSVGNPFYSINFRFMGSENNDPSVDMPPLYDLSVLNIAHYRNSADYQESCYIAGQATPVISGVDATWARDIMNNGVELGSRHAILLPENGKASLLQSQANSQTYESMKLLELQMIGAGGKVLERAQTERTATEARFDINTENSTLASIANNASMAFKDSLRICQQFIGIPDDVDLEFALNNDFELDTLTPEAIAQIVYSVERGIISWEEGRELMRHAGLTHQNDSEARTSIDRWMASNIQPESSPEPAAPTVSADAA